MASMIATVASLSLTGVPVGSVTPESFAASAIDPAATVPGARTLGSGPGQAASGAELAGALDEVSELVAGPGISLTTVGQGTQRVSIASPMPAPTTFQGAGGKVVLGEFAASSLTITQFPNGTPDPHACVRVVADAAAQFLGYQGTTIALGSGDAAPDVTITRSQSGTLLVNGSPLSRQLGPSILATSVTGDPAASTGGAALASFPIAAGALAAGQVLRLVAGGRITSATGANQSHQFILRIGGIATLTATSTLGTGTSPRMWLARFEIAIGPSAASQQVAGEVSITGPSSATMASTAISLTGFDDTEHNMAVAHDVALFAKHGTNSTSMSTDLGFAHLSLQAP